MVFASAWMPSIDERSVFMRKSIYLPALALLLGAAGFGLRRWAVGSGFEQDTGLALSGHPSFLALGGLSVLAVLLLALLCRGGRSLEPEECPLALSNISSLHMTLGSAAALLTVLAGAAAFLDFSSVVQLQGISASTLLDCATPFLLGAFALVSGGCLLLLAKRRYQAGMDVSFSFLPLIPAFFYCFWLMDVYRVRASDPIILDFAWFFLGAITLVLALYCSAGFAFRNGKPFTTLFWSLLAVVFALTTLADQHSLAEYLLLSSGILWCLTQAHALLQNLDQPRLVAPEAPPEEPPAGDTGADDDDDVDIVL